MKCLSFFSLKKEALGDASHYWLASQKSKDFCQ